MKNAHRIKWSDEMVLKARELRRRKLGARAIAKRLAEIYDPSPNRYTVQDWIDYQTRAYLSYEGK